MRSSARRFNERRESVEAPGPSSFVAAAPLSIRDALVQHDDLRGVTVARLEGDRDAFRESLVRFAVEPPTIDQPVRRFDRFERAANPDDATVRELIGDAILGADA